MQNNYRVFPRGNQSPSQNGDAPTCNVVRICSFAEWLYRPGDIVESRVLGTRFGTVSGYWDYDHIGSMAQGIKEFNDEHYGNAYVLVNPCAKSLLNRYRNRFAKYAKETTDDGVIIRLRYIPIDIDPTRYDVLEDGRKVKVTGIAATDDERAHALQRAVDIAHFFRSEGFDVAQFDSGNGAYVLPEIDLENTAENRALVGGVIAFCAQEFSDDKADVDLATKNPARILRAIGSVNRKGDHCAERPHRQTQIIRLPEDRTIIPVEKLREWAGRVERKASKAKSVNVPYEVKSKRRGVRLDVQALVDERNLECSKVKDWKGDLLFELEHCPFDPDHVRTARIIQHAEGRATFSCFHNSCQPHDMVSLAEKLGIPVVARPEEQIVCGTDRHRVLSEALDAVAEDPDVFLRGTTLVRLAGDVSIPLAPEGLSCRLTARRKFVAFKGKTKGGADVFKPKEPPAWLMNAILQHTVYPGVRTLKGIAQAPFPKPDGSLVTTPGYDPITGFYLSPTITISVPETVSKAAAQAAADRLFDLVSDFPFASAEDQAVWLASLLTIIARPSINGPVPGFAIVANKAGTGKGLLTRITSAIATGKFVSNTDYPTRPEEASKLLTTLALESKPIVNFDNLDQGTSYGSGPLDSKLTSTHVHGRILGLSKTTGDLELRCCWFLTGNNLVPGADAHRRWLVCNLKTNLENPEERDDVKISGIDDYVLENRASLVRDALLILKAHAQAGRPNGGWGALGSFERWDRIVRGAVWFATGWDCNKTRKAAAEESPERLDHLALMEAWKGLPEGDEKGKGLTVRKAIELAMDHADLGEVLSRFTRNGSIPTPEALGKVLRGFKNQNVEGIALQIRGYEKKTALWGVGPLD